MGENTNDQPGRFTLTAASEKRYLGEIVDAKITDLQEIEDWKKKLLDPELIKNFHDPEQFVHTPDQAFDWAFRSVKLTDMYKDIIGANIFDEQFWPTVLKPGRPHKLLSHVTAKRSLEAIEQDLSRASLCYIHLANRYSDDITFVQNKPDVTPEKLALHRGGGNVLIDGWYREKTKKIDAALLDHQTDSQKTKELNQERQVAALVLKPKVGFDYSQDILRLLRLLSDTHLDILMQ